ncbi:hypothetical protein [Demequina sp. SO4-18]|uniref:hypothetical protein n=1 Tax=Demequina sp. SO4-18 TaxID=3401026 RepID=UPI003B5A781D
MGQWLTHSIVTTASTDTYHDKRLRIYYNSSEGVSDSSNDFDVTGGDWPGRSNASPTISIPFGGGQQLIYDETTRFNKTYGSSYNVTFAASLSGINYWGGTITESGSSNVPAREYAVPTAPNKPTVTRNNDGSQTVAWYRNASTAGRVETQRVQRRIFNGSWGGWATIATLGTDYTTSGSQSYTDTATIGNRAYEYRIVAQNSSGSATSTPSGTVYTTPATPSSVVASKLSGGDIRVRIDPAQVVGSVEFVIQHSTNGGASYSALATVDAGTILFDYVHTSPEPTDTHRYRVACKVDASTAEAGDNLQSGWRTSNTVQLEAPPNAPSNLGPSSPVALEYFTRTLTWTHNPVDSSAQTKFQLRHRAAGGAWTTTAEVTSGDSEWEMGLDTYYSETDVEWEVRTWGSHEDPSPWSPTASFVVSDLPQVNITAPADSATLTDSDLTVAWAYTHSDSPQAQWRVTLYGQSGNALEARAGSGTTSSVAMDTALQDGRTYTVYVEVRSATGLWSSASEAIGLPAVESTVTVDYVSPREVGVSAEFYRDSGAVAITITPDGANFRGTWVSNTAYFVGDVVARDGERYVCVEDVQNAYPPDSIAGEQFWDLESEGDFAETVAATIERSLDGGESWETLAAGVPLDGGGTTVLDMTAPTRATVLYRGTAISAIPSTAVGEPVELVIDEQEYAYLGYGPGFATVLVFYGNLSPESSAGREEALEHFANRVGSDNRPAGVIISGERRDRSVGVSATLLNADGMATHEDFEDAALHGGVMLYRDPTGRTGRRIFGMIGGVSTASPWEPLSQVSFRISESARA